MKNILRKMILFFLIMTGSIAGIGLLIMDSLLPRVLSPEHLSEAIEIPDSLNAMPMTILNKEESALHAIYADVPESPLVVLYCHDGSGHVYQRLPFIQKLTELGVSVLAIDYRGFGLSDSVEISDESLLLDIKQSYDLLRRKKWNSTQIILYGQGISAGIQGEFLKDKTCGGWILDNPIPSLQDALTGSLNHILASERLSLYPAMANYRGVSMVCFDPEKMSSSTLNKLKSTNSGLQFCETEGSRSPHSWEATNWDSWDECMIQFLGRMETVPDMEKIHRISGKKAKKEKPVGQTE